MSHRRRRGYEPLWRFRLLLQTCTAWQDAFDSRHRERDQAGCGSEDGCGFGLYGGDGSDQTVGLIVNAGREIYCVGMETAAVSAGFERPEEGVDERLAVGSVDGAEEQVGGCVIGEDFAVSEVADEEIV